MAMIEALLQELEQEAKTTRRVLERVPGDQLGWAPHTKSMTLGQLSLHVAGLPGAIAEIAMTSPFQAPQFTQPSAQTAAELVPTLEQSLVKARTLVGERTIPGWRRRGHSSTASGNYLPCRVRPCCER